MGERDINPFGLFADNIDFLDPRDVQELLA